MGSWPYWLLPTNKECQIFSPSLSLFFSLSRSLPLSVCTSMRSLVYLYILWALLPLLSLSIYLSKCRSSIFLNLSLCPMYLYFLYLRYICLSVYLFICLPVSQFSCLLVLVSFSTCIRQYFNHTKCLYPLFNPCCVCPFLTFLFMSVCVFSFSVFPYCHCSALVWKSNERVDISIDEKLTETK